MQERQQGNSKKASMRNSNKPGHAYAKNIMELGKKLCQENSNVVGKIVQKLAARN